MQMSKSLPKNSKPLQVGLTGGIGAGKTTVSHVFKTMGIPVFNADNAGHQVLNENLEVKFRICNLLGNDAYHEGKPDRSFIAAQVFNNSELREALNSIVHPAVADLYVHWLAAHSTAAYIIKESAIIFEIGLYLKMDANVLVTAPVEMRIRRVLKRNDIAESEIRKRMTAQWSDEKKEALSDFVILNNEKLAVLPQVLRIHNELLSKGEVKKI